MNDSVAIVEEFSHKDVQNTTISQQDENLEKKIEDMRLMYKNVVMDFTNEASTLCNKIENIGDHWKNLTNKYSQLEVVRKEKEKYSVDFLYIDGEIQYKKLKIDRDKEKINETKNLMQEAVVELKDREHEEEIVLKKYIDKHNAYKKAAKYYKTHLNFYICAEKNEETFHVTVCYFTVKFDDTYSFTINKNENENQWTLTSVKPNLEESQFKALQRRFCNTNNLSALLCTVRKIFMLYI